MSLLTAPAISVIVPYYRNPQMLKWHLRNWENYSDPVREMMQLLIIDDGSPEPAEPVVKDFFAGGKRPFALLELYRIMQDIPWNRGGARNLGAHVAETPWLLHMDIDHILPPGAAESLADLLPHLPTGRWFRFPRYRVGAADETRNKDDIPREQKFGKIKPHIDSYLVPRELYWQAGGYNENFSGCLGGGSPFLKQLENVAKPGLLNELIHLHVYTRDAVADASDMNLSRDRSEYMRRKKLMEREGTLKGMNPLRFEWERLI